MDLQFPGIGSAFNPGLGNTSAYLVAKQTAYLLDCGSTVFSSLFPLLPWDSLHAIKVLVSHRHQDHTGSLGTLISFATHVKNIPVTVVHPDCKLQPLLALMGVAEDQYVFECTTAFCDESLQVDFMPVKHSDKIPAFGLRLKMGQQHVYYSGDSSGLPGEVLKDYLSGRLDNLYQDISFLTQNPSGHGSFEALKQQVPRQMRARVFPIHWDTDARQLILDAGFGLVDLVKREDDQP